MQQSLKPLSFGEILDGAFTLYRRNFSTFAATVLAPGVLAARAHLALGRPRLTAASSRDRGAMVRAVVGPGGLTFLLGSLLGAVMWCALVRQASRAYSGEPTSLADGLNAAGRSALPLLGAALVAAVLVGVPVMAGGLFVPATGAMMAGAGLILRLLVLLMLVLAYAAMCLAFMAVFAVVAPAVVCEGRGPFAAVNRSYLLVRGSFLPVMGLILVVTVMELLIARGVDAAGGAFGILGPEAVGATLVVRQALGLGISVFAAPLAAALMVVLYFDLRVRTEALDVQMMTDRLAVAAG